jgi:hypothetical protein
VQTGARAAAQIPRPWGQEISVRLGQQVFPKMT